MKKSCPVCGAPVIVERVEIPSPDRFPRYALGPIRCSGGCDMKRPQEWLDAIRSSTPTEVTP